MKFTLGENHEVIRIPKKENVPVYVFDLGYHKTPPSHRYGPAVRQYYLLHLIKSGKGAIERNGEKTLLSAGQMFLIYPEETTVYYSDENDPLEYCWIGFYGDYAKTLIEQTTPHLNSNFEMGGYIAIKNAVDSNVSDSIGLLNVLFRALNSIKVIPEKQPEPDVVAVALRYLEENYFNSFDVTELSSQLGYSRAYFSTLFKNRTGETPYNYLNKIRIKHAKDYLEKTDKSVEEIALSVGFSSLDRFSAFFKTSEKISPLAYRKSYRV